MFCFDLCLFLFFLCVMLFGDSSPPGFPATFVCLYRPPLLFVCNLTLSSEQRSGDRIVVLLFFF